MTTATRQEINRLQPITVVGLGGTSDRQRRGRQWRLLRCAASAAARADTTAAQDTARPPAD